MVAWLLPPGLAHAQPAPTACSTLLQQGADHCEDFQSAGLGVSWCCRDADNWNQCVPETPENADGVLAYGGNNDECRDFPYADSGVGTYAGIDRGPFPESSAPDGSHHFEAVEVGEGLFALQGNLDVHHREIGIVHEAPPETGGSYLMQGCMRIAAENVDDGDSCSMMAFRDDPTAETGDYDGVFFHKDGTTLRLQNELREDCTEPEAVLEVGQWVDLAFRFDDFRVARKGDLRIFVDGTELTSCALIDHRNIEVANVFRAGVMKLSNSEPCRPSVNPGGGYTLQLERYVVDSGPDPIPPYDLGCDAIEPAAEPDEDGDGVADPADNCVQVFNSDQADADAGQDDDSSLPGVQQYGDVCDADLDNDGTVGASDFFDVLRPCLGADIDTQPECSSSDLDGDGVVGSSDFFEGFRPALGSPPGPGITVP